MHCRRSCTTGSRAPIHARHRHSRRQYRPQSVCLGCGRGWRADYRRVTTEAVRPTRPALPRRAPTAQHDQGRDATPPVCLDRPAEQDRLWPWCDQRRHQSQCPSPIRSRKTLLFDRERGNLSLLPQLIARNRRRRACLHKCSRHVSSTVLRTDLSRYRDLFVM